ncbi:MAG: tryptophan 7-halogenase, partial [Elusimicrobia bacterium]|nr:tryptophan 7-halogenase [Elusimicrobiota bacterium]
MKRDRCDFLVVGGGPAGTTAATLFKRYAPDSRVVLLERAVFPRHHVGESLLPGMLPVLREMGVHEKIARAGFVRKVGVTFVWGKDRRPWDADFSELEVELGRYGVNLALGTTWQVPRADYDALLLAHARDCGVEVREGTAAVEPLELRGAVAGARLRAPDGAAGLIFSRVLADCSGQSGFLSKVRTVRRASGSFRNVAVYGYFRGAPWKFRYTGAPDASRIFICSAPEGWFWYIPISQEIVSVGLVTKASSAAARGEAGMREFFLSAIRRRPELAGFLKNRPLVRGMDPSAPEKDLFAAADWSYDSVAGAGPGWYAAGDAALFIDPILSSGVMMAHLSGRRCAYSALAERAGWSGDALRAVRADYGTFCREVGADFLELVKIWYGQEPSARKWFKAGGLLARPRSPGALSDKAAFVSTIAGLNHHFNRVHACGAGALTNVPRHVWRFQSGDRDTFVPVLFQTRGGPKAWHRAVPGAKKGIPGPERVLRAVRPTGWRRVSVGFVPIEGTGRLGAVCQAEFAARAGAAVSAKRMLPSLYRDVLESFDGRRSVIGAAARAAERHPLPAALIARETLSAADELAAAGAIEFGAPLRAAPARRWRGDLASLRRAEEALVRGDAPAARTHAGLA